MTREMADNLYSIFQSFRADGAVSVRSSKALSKSQGRSQGQSHGDTAKMMLVHGLRCRLWKFLGAQVLPIKKSTRSNWPMAFSLSPRPRRRWGGEKEGTNEERQNKLKITQKDILKGHNKRTKGKAGKRRNDSLDVIQPLVA
jgi:hypothetical protein